MCPRRSFPLLARSESADERALITTVVEPSGHGALYLHLAEVNGGPRARGLRRVHLFEGRARVAHLLLRLEVPDEDGRSLCFVDKQLESGCVDAGRGSLGLLDLGTDLRDPLSGHFSEPDDTCVH